MRWLEGDDRAASITGPESGTSRRTHASNFSRFTRSGTLSVTETTSIPNCLKQSDSPRRAVSFRSTKATRAVDFLLGGMLAMELSWAYLMALVQESFWPVQAWSGKVFEGQ